MFFLKIVRSVFVQIPVNSNMKLSKNDIKIYERHVFRNTFLLSSDLNSHVTPELKRSFFIVGMKKKFVSTASYVWTVSEFVQTPYGIKEKKIRLWNFSIRN